MVINPVFPQTTTGWSQKELVRETKGPDFYVKYLGRSERAKLKGTMDAEKQNAGNDKGTIQKCLFGIGDLRAEVKQTQTTPMRRMAFALTEGEIFEVAVVVAPMLSPRLDSKGLDDPSLESAGCEVMMMMMAFAVICGVLKNLVRPQFCKSGRTLITGTRNPPPFRPTQSVFFQMSIKS